MAVGEHVTLDVERLRSETPGCAHVAHLNNAGSSLPPAPVLDAVVDHLQREAEIGGYEAAAERAGRLAHTYDALARLIGAQPHELAVIENATRAWDMAFYSFRFGPGDRILTGRAEYASNWIALRQVAQRTGAVVEVVPDDEHGQLDVAALERMVDERVKLVSLVHVPTQSGLVNPAAAVGRLTRAAGVPLLLDACQSVGQLPVDVEAIGCDVLSATGRKFLRGPRGTGFLYVRRALLERLEPPFLDMLAAEWQPDGGYELRPDARRFENWETYVAGKIGLGVAADYALALGIDRIWPRARSLAAELRKRLAELPSVTVLDRGEVLGAIVTFSVAGRRVADVQAALAAQSINVSTTTASSARLDLDARGIEELVRASVHYYNTAEELDRLVGCVAGLA
jgi:selenocysteine lyase/cysteine desulfurase